MAFSFALPNFIARGREAEPAAAPDMASLQNELKDIAEKNAREAAASEGRQPNLTDYFAAAMSLSDQAAGAGVKWTTEVMADFSGRTLDGFTIRRIDMNPARALDPETAHEYSADEQEAARQAQHTLRAVIPLGEGTTKNTEEGVERLTDTYNLDGNDQIDVEEVSGFYKKLEESLNFNKTNFHNVTFHPASTLCILENAEGATYGRVVLDGLNEGETLQLGQSQQERFNNVSLINAEGGTVKVGGIVDNLQLNGHEVQLVVAAGGQVNALQASSEQMNITVEAGGTLKRPSFENVTLAEGSSFAGAFIDGNRSDGKLAGFRNSDLSQADFSKAQISGIEFDNSTFGKDSFAGASLRNTVFNNVSDFGALREALASAAYTQNVLVNGEPMRGIDDLARIEQVSQQKAAEAAKAEALQQQLAGIGATLLGAMQGVTGPAVPTAAAPALVQGISGGDNVTLSQQQEQGPQQANTAEERYAQALARMARLEEQGLVRSS